MEERSIETMPLDGGWLCLDFINTIHDRTVEEPFEYLPKYDKILEWSLKLDIITSTLKRELEKAAIENQKQAEQAHNQLIKAREILYSIFLAIAKNSRPNDSSQVKFNTLLKKALSKLDMRISGNLEVQQQWKNKSSLDYPLYPIIKSAYDLLTSDMLDRVKECGACGWLFLDQSKNKSRKWCSMETCGSNVKAKRYYHRNKKK